jgi:superfamily II DNA or RNA helicase
MSKVIYAPGARVEIRDAEWLVKRVDRTSSGGQALSVMGLSDLVRDKEAIFLTELEADIKRIDPEKTRLVPDVSAYYLNSRLYIESLLRQTPPTDEQIHIGHRGAMDLVPYQLEPALQALRQPRQRILIADAVGLGKTIECGILLSELIKRGKGKRILVLAVKSMLTQFQKELWARFTIPLVRLDSIGIQRIRNRIPTNHNPFYYYDKAIISIDTLKQESEYRTYIESSYWDIIVIDEAHNVAERGSSGTRSMRAKLARLLSQRSDTLIMLSATPHDGKARSFASLMNMLNPTAIANPEAYTAEDIEGLYIRRFKKDIRHQVPLSFKEREIALLHHPASDAEEAAFEQLAQLTFQKVDAKKSGHLLFKTTLEKALFSSPAACRETIRNRIARLAKQDAEAYAPDIQQLEKLDALLAAISLEHFSKFQALKETITQTLQWNPHDPADRLVIFTERIETLHFLETHLPKALKLKPKQVASLYGSMSDVDLNTTVQQFGSVSEPVRLLICSDVASEGINLHHLSHKLIHFDVPWSLMVFQQRNGRIDRYGQEQTPTIRYLLTDTKNPRIRGDQRILELLIEKDQQVMENIGDPSEFSGCYDVESEEKLTASAMEAGKSAEDFAAELERKAPDPLAILWGEVESPVAGDDALDQLVNDRPSLFPSDFAYLEDALQFVREESPIQVERDPDRQAITLTPPADLRYRLKYLPPEISSEAGQFTLTADLEAVQREIIECRKEDAQWPRIHLLWEQHPVMEWLNDKVVAAFKRNEAPILALGEALESNEVIFLLSGLIPNRKSHPILHHWFAVRFMDGQVQNTLELAELFERLKLMDKDFPNRQAETDTDALQALLPLAVTEARKQMTAIRKQWTTETQPKLDQHLQRLKTLKHQRDEQLELAYGGKQLSQQALTRKQREAREIEKLFTETQTLIKDTMTTEDAPYIKVAALFTP